MTVITIHPAAPETVTDNLDLDPLVVHRIHRGELTAGTAAGRRFVEVAESLEQSLAEAADRHDGDASYPHEALDLVRRTGLPWAPAPEPAGGWGLASVHDLIVGASRLARGNPSLTIGLNMHLIAMDLLAHRARCLGPDRASTVRARAAIDRITGSRVLIAAAISEHAQDLLRPRTRATRTEDGWIIDGRKAFCTMSPAADLLNVAVAYTRDDAEERIGFVQLPTQTAGVIVENDWDALGMRTSGSHSVTFDGVRIAAEQLQDALPFGRADRGLMWGKRSSHARVRRPYRRGPDVPPHRAVAPAGRRRPARRALPPTRWRAGRAARTGHIGVACPGPRHPRRSLGRVRLVDRRHHPPAGFLPLVLGNVRERAIADMYRDDPVFQRLRAADFDGPCGRCDHRELCGGSRSRAYAATGDPFASDPACAYALLL